MIVMIVNIYITNVYTDVFYSPYVLTGAHCCPGCAVRRHTGCDRTGAPARGPALNIAGKPVCGIAITVAVALAVDLAVAIALALASALALCVTLPRA